MKRRAGEIRESRKASSRCGCVPGLLPVCACLCMCVNTGKLIGFNTLKKPEDFNLSMCCGLDTPPGGNRADNLQTFGDF